MAVSLHADLTLVSGRLLPDVIVHVGGNGQILEVDGPGLEDEALSPEGSADEILGSTSGEFAAPSARRIHRLRKKILLPGFVNGHSHAFQRLLRGRTEQRPVGRPGDDFWTWRAAMYRLTQNLDPESIEIVSRLAFMEMLLAGYTHVVEFHYLHHQQGGRPYDDPIELTRRVLAAAESAGIGITLLRVAYQRGGSDILASAEQRRFIDPDPEAYAAAFELTEALAEPEGRRPVQIGIAAHSIRALDRAYLEALGTLAGEKGCVLHAHVAEQPREIDECLAEHGCRPVEFVDQLGLVSPRFTAIHATHLGPGEAELLGSRGAGVCVCPTTERNLGDGLPDLEALVAAGVPLSVGSDSQARIDPFAELRGLEEGERLRRRVRNCLAPPGGGELAPVLFEIAAGGGASCAGLAAGQIAPGYRGDLIAIDLEDRALVGTGEGSPAGEAMLASLFLSGNSSLVRDVWIGGRHLVEDGLLLRWATAAEEYREVAGRVWKGGGTPG